jgi:caa(3)-type oxidase subunit IV
MAEHAEHTIEEEYHDHGGGHNPNYAKIYISLVILLMISIAGPFLGIFWVTLATAFGIALVKATLVVQNFMHLKWERALIGWVLAAALLLMFLLFAGVAPDIMRHDGVNWENVAAKQATERGIPLEEHGGGAEEQ